MNPDQILGFIVGIIFVLIVIHAWPASEEVTDDDLDWLKDQFSSAMSAADHEYGTYDASGKRISIWPLIERGKTIIESFRR